MKHTLAFLAVLLPALPACVPALDYDFKAMIQPIPATAKFSDPDYCIWCGAMEIMWADGRNENMHSPERRQLFFDNGRRTVLLFATTDSKRNETSFNVRIPLRDLQKD